jgi:hypothetical protein
MYTSSMLRDGMAVMHKVEPVTPQGQGFLDTSERTPLLKKPSSHHRATRRDSGFDAPEVEEQVSSIEKPSTARLVLVAITSCLSIFLCSPRSTRPSPRLSQRPLSRIRLAVAQAPPPDRHSVPNLKRRRTTCRQETHRHLRTPPQSRRQRPLLRHR